MSELIDLFKSGGPARGGRKHKHFVAALGYEPKTWPTLRDEWLRVCKLRGARIESRAIRGTSLHAAITRRDPVDLRLARRRRANRHARVEAEQLRQDAARRSMMRAGRIARSMGWDVESSTDPHGHISSYYCWPRDWCGPPIRISDHEIPWTHERDCRAAPHGGFDGYAGPNLVIDRDRSKTWLRRALILAAAKRDVPL